MEDHVNPYASPAEPEDGGPLMAGLDGSAGPIKPYASAKTRARLVIFFLAVILVGDIASAISTGYQIELFQRVEVGEFDAEEIPENYTRQKTINLVFTIANLCTMVSFLMWFHRAHRNLPSLGATNLRYSPGWAVGFWFVPILSLYGPFLVMKEIWRGSDPATIPNSENPQQRPAGLALIGWWWALFLIMNIYGQFLGFYASDTSLPSELVDASWYAFARNVFILFAAILAILVVRRVTSNQEKRFRLLSESGDETIETNIEPEL